MGTKYFTDLNYTLGNEDTTLEREMIIELKSENVFSIAGSGSRCLPLLNESVKNLYCIDVSSHQLLLTELRMASIKLLEHEDFLKFWGFPPYGGYDYSFWRRDIFEKFELSQDCREYFFRLFNELNWESILYVGKWEKTFGVLAKIVQKVLGKDYNKILKFHNISDQAHFYNNEFTMKKWKVILFLLGNKSVFNALLYKGDFIKKNVSETHFEYYFQAFERLMTDMISRKSFFMNLCFEGKIAHEDGNTVEAEKSCFYSMKNSLDNNVNVELINKDMISAIKDKKDIDFLSLSDVPSYFSGDLEKNFLNDMAGSIKKDGIVVLRHYLRVANVDTSLFVDITPRFSELISKEKVQMYKVQVLQKK